ncbi:TPA: hypothetical protein QDB44_001697 [Burkholderia vietnamiensis]|nr:hypothetical protein [Burkholderia vietnamiensis]
MGPVILAALNNLQEMDQDRPWVTLFDRESRRHESRELHFAAIASDATTTTIRHVIARLAYEATMTNVLFLKIDDVTAEFESATTQIIGNNQLLATIAPTLRERMAQDKPIIEPGQRGPFATMLPTDLQAGQVTCAPMKVSSVPQWLVWGMPSVTIPPDEDLSPIFR